MVNGGAVMGGDDYRSCPIMGGLHGRTDLAADNLSANKRTAYFKGKMFM